MRGMPCGMHWAVGSPPSPPVARSTILASWMALYSGVSGACWPRPRGLVGSHCPLPMSSGFFHCPDQSGYFDMSCACPAASPMASQDVSRTAPINFRYVMAVLLQPEDIEHERVSLLLELRRIDQPASGHRARSRYDRDILPAVGLERHRRRGKPRADIDLPQFLQRGAVKRRDRA